MATILKSIHNYIGYTIKTPSKTRTTKSKIESDIKDGFKNCNKMVLSHPSEKTENEIVYEKKKFYLSNRKTPYEINLKFVRNGSAWETLVFDLEGKEKPIFEYEEMVFLYAFAVGNFLKKQTN